MWHTARAWLLAAQPFAKAVLGLLLGAFLVLGLLPVAEVSKFCESWSNNLDPETWISPPSASPE